MLIHRRERTSCMSAVPFSGAGVLSATTALAVVLTPVTVIDVTGRLQRRTGAWNFGGGNNVVSVRCRVSRSVRGSGVSGAGRSLAPAGGPPCQPVTGGLSGCFVASSSRVLSLRLSHHRTRSRRCSRCSPSFPWPLSGRTSCCSGTLTGFARPTGLTVQTPTDQSGTPTTDKSRRRQPDSGRRHHPDWSRRRAAV
jgi:hypothetical protein